MIRIYGIANCDTMKKAFAWLQANAIEYQFHDFKRAGLDAQLLDAWIDRVGWEALLNRRGMMWRRLDERTKQSIDQESARAVMLSTPSIIKRPVLASDGQLTIGFSAEIYQALLKKIAGMTLPDRHDSIPQLTLNTSARCYQGTIK